MCILTIFICTTIGWRILFWIGPKVNLSNRCWFQQHHLTPLITDMPQMVVGRGYKCLLENYMSWQKFFPTLAPLCPTKLNCTGECQVNGGNAGIHAALEAKKGNFWNGWPCLPPAWSLSSLSNTHCLRRLRTMQSVCKRVGQEQKLPQSWAKLIWGQSIFWNIASLVQEMWLNSLIAGDI